VLQEDPSPTAINSWIASTGSMARNPDELSENAIDSVNDIAMKSLDSSVTFEMSVESALPLLDTISSVMTAKININSAKEKTKRRYQRRLEDIDGESSPSTLFPQFETSLALITKFSALSLQDMVYGQAPIVSIKSTFKQVSVVDSISGSSSSSHSNKIEVPVTSTEKLSGVIAQAAVPQFTKASSGTLFMKSSLIEFDRTVFGSEFKDAVSEPISLYIDDFNACGTEGCNITFSLRTVETAYKNMSAEITNFCAGNSIASQNFTCADGKKVNIQCDGKGSHRTTHNCSDVEVEPTCSFISSEGFSASDCTIRKFDDQSVICNCRFLGGISSTTTTRRRLAGKPKVGGPISVISIPKSKPSVLAIKTDAPTIAPTLIPTASPTDSELVSFDFNLNLDITTDNSPDQLNTIKNVIIESVAEQFGLDKSAITVKEVGGSRRLFVEEESESAGASHHSVISAHDGVIRGESHIWLTSTRKSFMITIQCSYTALQGNPKYPSVTSVSTASSALSSYLGTVIDNKNLETMIKSKDSNIASVAVVVNTPAPSVVPTFAPSSGTPSALPTSTPTEIPGQLSFDWEYIFLLIVPGLFGIAWFMYRYYLAYAQDQKIKRLQLSGINLGGDFKDLTLLDDDKINKIAKEENNSIQSTMVLQAKLDSALMHSFELRRDLGLKSSPFQTHVVNLLSTRNDVSNSFRKRLKSMIRDLRAENTSLEHLANKPEEELSNYLELIMKDDVGSESAYLSQILKQNSGNKQEIRSPNLPSFLAKMQEVKEATARAFDDSSSKNVYAGVGTIPVPPPVSASNWLRTDRLSPSVFLSALGDSYMPTSAVLLGSPESSIRALHLNTMSLYDDSSYIPPVDIFQHPKIFEKIDDDDDDDDSTFAGKRHNYPSWEDVSLSDSYASSAPPPPPPPPSLSVSTAQRNGMSSKLALGPTRKASTSVSGIIAKNLSGKGPEKVPSLSSSSSSSLSPTNIPAVVPRISPAYFQTNFDDANAPAAVKVSSIIGKYVTQPIKTPKVNSSKRLSDKK